ncbi:type II toxin-antitoxin system HicA family toxin [Tuanshanicoccus lijuaniae]|uniref:type II toxin-antitoxin system HicA family toxin n=1 Tax=Aerococcaceae bacterium zg-1292 TaxID=2774330 RepID=UPI00193869B7|nr:type II toxin-antitoxin system HicA family toxin [Aerococcaceae bacterium zg-1292]QQA36957.1 type II toxin-antitoxin system HicA family toxin [Aerococcaceae bacterium zg-1292]
MNSKELIKMVEKDGWYKVATKGSHYHYQHHSKKGKVTIPHPKKDIPLKTAKRIIKQAGLT